MVLNDDRPLKIINAFENKSAAIIKLGVLGEVIVKIIVDRISGYPSKDEKNKKTNALDIKKFDPSSLPNDDIVMIEQVSYWRKDGTFISNKSILPRLFFDKLNFAQKSLVLKHS